MKKQENLERGLKIGTAAGMLQGMEFEFHSRGWKAVPFTGEKILNEGHANQMKTEYNFICHHGEW